MNSDFQIISYWKELEFGFFSWANKIKMSLKEKKTETLTSKSAESYFSRKITWRNLSYLILFNLWCVSYCCHFHHHLWLSTPFQSLLKQWLLLLFLQFHISLRLFVDVFSGRSNRKKVFVCVIWKVNKQNVFLWAFRGISHSLRLKKVCDGFQWHWIAFLFFFIAVLSCHRPLCHLSFRRISWFHRCSKKLIFFKTKQRFIAFDKKAFLKKFFLPFYKRNSEGGFIFPKCSPWILKYKMLERLAVFQWKSAAPFHPFVIYIWEYLRKWILNERREKRLAFAGALPEENDWKKLKKIRVERNNCWRSFADLFSQWLSTGRQRVVTTPKEFH